MDTPDLSGLSVIGSTEYFPWLSSGGTDHVAWQVARRFVDFGASVTMIAGVPPHTPAAEIDATVDGVRAIALATIDIGQRLGVEFSLPRGTKGAIGRALAHEKADVFYASGLHFPITWPLVRAARASKRPLVTTCHVGVVPLSSAPLRVATRVYEQSIGRWILHSSHEVIAVADEVRKHILPLAGTTPITVVPNGVDVDRFARTNAGPTPRIVFVGRLIANKGPQELVEALADLRAHGDSFQAFFVGDGPLKETLQERARATGVGEQLHFTGHVTNVEEYLRPCDIFVRPSHSEGMPLATLEAMAAGCCVVASDIPGNAELVGQNENGLLVPVGDTTAIANALRRLLSEPQLRRRLSANARAAAQSYSWDATAKGSARVLLHALQDSHS
jgi:glycosyltransferase involved in cell wall biosynthesis